MKMVCFADELSCLRTSPSSNHDTMPMFLWLRVYINDPFSENATTNLALPIAAAFGDLLDGSVPRLLWKARSVLATTSFQSGDKID